MRPRTGVVFPCPACGHRSDHHSVVGGPPRVPEPEDVAVCISCGQVLVFVRDLVGLRQRLPTSQELAFLLEQDTVVARVRDAWVETFQRAPSERVAS